MKRTKKDSKNKSEIKLNYLQAFIDDADAYSKIKPSNRNERQRKKRWKEIGEEVLTRKSLFIAAIKDLAEHGVEGDIQKLAATDVFVEKATKIITKRAQILIYSGVFVSVIIAFLLLSFGRYVKNRGIEEDVINYKIEYIRNIMNDKDLKIFMTKDSNSLAKEILYKPMELDGYTFSLLMFKKVSTSAFFIAIAVFLAYIARALFHEGFTLYSKRHSLRFGRLYVYLKKGKIDFQELEEAFQWNKEFPTAFKDIRPELLSKTMLSVFPEITKYLTEAAKNYAEILKERNKPSHK